MPKINECQLGYSQDYTEMNNVFYQRVLLHKQIHIYTYMFDRPVSVKKNAKV